MKLLKTICFIFHPVLQHHAISIRGNKDAVHLSCKTVVLFLYFLYEYTTNYYNVDTYVIDRHQRMSLRH